MEQKCRFVDSEGKVLWRFHSLMGRQAYNEIGRLDAELKYSNEAVDMFPIPLINGKLSCEDRIFIDAQKAKRRELWESKYLPELRKRVFD